MKKNFAVSSNSLTGKQSYVIVLDFEKSTIAFHKVKRGKEVKRVFPFSACVKLEKHKKEVTQLGITFGHEAPYKKAVSFHTVDERELFCNLVHAVIVCGARAWKLFKSLDQTGSGKVDGSKIGELKGAGAGAGAGAAGSAGAAAPTKNVDFCQFLISFASAQQQISRKEPKKKEDGKGGSRDSVPDRSESIQSLPASSKMSTGSVMPGAGTSENDLSGVIMLRGEGILLMQQHTSRLDALAATMSATTVTYGTGSAAAGASAGAAGGKGPQAGQQAAGAGAGGKAAGGGAGSAGAGEVTHTLSSRGTLIFTNYRVMYRDYAQGTKNDCSCEVPWFSVQRAMVTNKGRLRFQCKDSRALEFGFDARTEWVESLLKQWINPFAFPGNQTKSFAFTHKMPVVGSAGVNGWNLYNPMKEYERLSIASPAAVAAVAASQAAAQAFADSATIAERKQADLAGQQAVASGAPAKGDAFRVVFSNATFHVSDTYPAHFMIPAAVDEGLLKKICEYRSKQRVPAVVWLHPKTRASLSRCAQPLPGVKGKRSVEDEKLFALLRECNPRNRDTLYIVDARPYKAAVGNTVMGKGYENISHYEKCQLLFMDIDNIHAIRRSLERVNELCSPESKTYDEGTWNAKLEATGWLQYLRLILSSAARMAAMLEDEGASVVVHCSDGWDRTSQLVSTCELLLDPFYRTLQGFAVLVEKEWLSFGHKFAERCGHGDSNFSHSQRAPIFTQWLDVVWQLTRQYPLAFEFSEQFLIEVQDQMMGGRFGTFLYNSAKERHEADVRNKTASLWTHTCAPANRARFTNPVYRPQGRLYPSFSAKRVVFWESLHLRYDREMQIDLQNASGACPSLQVTEASNKTLAAYENLKSNILMAGLDLKKLESTTALTADEMKQMRDESGLEIKRESAAAGAAPAAASPGDSKSAGAATAPAGTTDVSGTIAGSLGKSLPSSLPASSGGSATSSKSPLAVVTASAEDFDALLSAQGGRHRSSAAPPPPPEDDSPPPSPGGSGSGKRGGGVQFAAGVATADKSTTLKARRGAEHKREVSTIDLRRVSEDDEDAEDGEREEEPPTPPPEDEADEGSDVFAQPTESPPSSPESSTRSLGGAGGGKVARKKAAAPEEIEVQDGVLLGAGAAAAAAAEAAAASSGGSAAGGAGDAAAGAGDAKSAALIAAKAFINPKALQRAKGELRKGVTVSPSPHAAKSLLTSSLLARGKAQLHAAPEESAGDGDAAAAPATVAAAPAAAAPAAAAGPADVASPRVRKLPPPLPGAPAAGAPAKAAPPPPPAKVAAAAGTGASPKAPAKAPPPAAPAAAGAAGAARPALPSAGSIRSLQLPPPPPRPASSSGAGAGAAAPASAPAAAAAPPPAAAPAAAVPAASSPSGGDEEEVVEGEGVEFVAPPS